MSGSWQECMDSATGQPYYWNTVSNQVRWDCPPNLPPPQLVTNISLATPASMTRESSPALLSSLVSGYDSEDSDNEQAEDKQPEAPEAKDDFIGPVIPKPPDKEREVPEKKTVEEADDILSLIEAEKPPDYTGIAQAKLPSCKSGRRKTSGQPQPRSMLSLANYDDSDSEAETEADKRVTRLDQFGRLVFNQTENCESDWQTEEQRQALLSYRREEQTNLRNNKVQAAKSPENVRRFDNSIPGSRKRRLDLPKGKFNKMENSVTEEEEAESKKQEVKPVPFVKSSSILEGTIESKETNNTILKVERTSPEKEEISATNDVGEFTAELVEKMEHFKVAQEKVSALKTVAIKLEALYSAWSSGALSLSYLQTFLESARKKVSEAEAGLSFPPWTTVWDRLVPFTFSSSSSSSFSSSYLHSLTLHCGPATARQTLYLKSGVLRFEPR